MTDYPISRDSRRVPLETRVSLRFERFSGFISEYSSNVSPGGMFITTQAPSPVGTLLDFEFQLGDGFQLIKGTGEVVWIRSDDQGPGKPPGMGLRFLRLSKGSRELIYKIVDEFIHQGGEPFDLEAGHTPGPSPAGGQAEAAGAAVAAALSGIAPAPGQPTPPQLEPVPAPQDRPVPSPAGAPPAVAMPAAPGPEAAPPPDTSLSSLSLPALAARTFGGGAAAATAQPAAAATPAPPPDLRVPLGGYASAAAEPAAGWWSPARLAMVIVAAAVVGLGAAAFLFQDRLMKRAGLLGREEGEAAAPAAMPADARREAGGVREPAADAGARAAAPEKPPASASGASMDAIPEPAGQAPDAGRERRAAAASGRAPAPAGPARQPAAVPAAPLTAIESITWRLAGDDTELTVRGDGPIRAGGYTRARLEGGSPRELIRIRGIRSPYTPAQVAVGSSQLKQVRTGHHVVPGGQELHLVLDLADSGVVVRRIEEVDGVLVVRLGRG